MRDAHLPGESLPGSRELPYGQITDDVPNATTGVVGKPGNDPARCRIPGTDGLRTDDAGDTVDTINVPVEAQLADRRADKAVYCSCRCAGPDDSARYCECPSGYKCEELVKELGLAGWSACRFVLRA